jgi:hypothetical protein
MDVNTGEIKMVTQEEIKSLIDNWIEVSKKQMTMKQSDKLSKNQQPVVSPHDNRSELGKLRIQEAKKLKNRKKRKAQKKSQRRNRKIGSNYE